MGKHYGATMHNVVKALADAGVVFPVSRAELLSRAGKLEIGVDFGKKIALAKFCEEIKTDYFENKCQFFCALGAAVPEVKHLSQEE